MRREYCEKNGIIITYTDSNVSFEERDTAKAILISNEGKILHSNFENEPEKTRCFLDDYFESIQRFAISDLLIKWGMLSKSFIILSPFAM